jgi:hypothetical protein
MKNQLRDIYSKQAENEQLNKNYNIKTLLGHIIFPPFLAIIIYFIITTKAPDFWEAFHLIWGLIVGIGGSIFCVIYLVRYIYYQKRKKYLILTLKDKDHKQIENYLYNEIVAKYIVNFAKNYLYKRLPIYLTCCNI